MFQTIAHEIGHTLGMGHTSHGVMKSHAGAHQYFWTPDDRTNFEKYYQRMKDHWCFEPKDDACCDSQQSPDEGMQG